MKRLLLLCLLLCMTTLSSIAQLTYPTAFNLSSGPYTFTEWASTNAALTYPANMILHRYGGTDASQLVLAANWTSAYNLTSGARITGLGTDGLQFGNSGSNPFVGAAVVALNSTGRSALTVSFTAQLLSHLTPLPTRREWAIKVQYSLGDPNVWTDATDAFGNVVQFVTTNKSAPSSAEVIGPVTLPSAVI